MITAGFDSLAAAKQLESAGFSREQAEAQANIFQQQMAILQKQMELRNEALNNSAKEREDRMREELATKADLQVAIQAAKYDLLKWMVTGFITNAAVIIAVLGYLK